MDVCGCSNGFTYYENECVPSDEKAAKAWIDDFNIGYQEHVHDYTVAYFTYETNITDHNYAQVKRLSGNFKNLLLSRSVSNRLSLVYGLLLMLLMARKFSSGKNLVMLV